MSIIGPVSGMETQAGEGLGQTGNFDEVQSRQRAIAKVPTGYRRRFDRHPYVAYTGNGTSSNALSFLMRTRITRAVTGRKRGLNSSARMGVFPIRFTPTPCGATIIAITPRI